MLDRYQAIDPQKLCLTPGARLLDVGCGTGRHLLEFDELANHAPPKSIVLYGRKVERAS